MRQECVWRNKEASVAKVIEEGGEQRGRGDQSVGLRCRGSSAIISGAGEGGGGASENK